MAKTKKKLLPKNFETLLKSNDLDALKAVFETCDIDARGGYAKQTAIAFNECPDELTRWLVMQGADLSACDSHGETPLHARSINWRARLDVLLELGADVNHGEGKRGTPLHMAAGSYKVGNARLLLAHGAHVDALDKDNMTPLALALRRCGNIDIEGMAGLAELLLDAGARKPSDVAALVSRIGINFEFHRIGFNKDMVDAVSTALDKLYALFVVTPVARRAVHDGKSPVVAKSARWEDAHQELWELLVPSSGSAETVQGEVVRISGKIHSELARNGGANWDADFKKMGVAFAGHVCSGVPLPKSALIEASDIVAGLKRTDDGASGMCKLAVDWVALNPKPAKLPPPDYKR